MHHAPSMRVSTCLVQALCLPLLIGIPVVTVGGCTGGLLTVRSTGCAVATTGCTVCVCVSGVTGIVAHSIGALLTLVHGRCIRVMGEKTYAWPPPAMQERDHGNLQRLA